MRIVINLEEKEKQIAELIKRTLIYNKRKEKDITIILSNTIEEEKEITLDKSITREVHTKNVFLLRKCIREGIKSYIPKVTTTDKNTIIKIHNAYLDGDSILIGVLPYKSFSLPKVDENKTDNNNKL